MNEADVDFVITHPEGYELSSTFVQNARVEYDQLKAFEGADFVYAKNWAAVVDYEYDVAGNLKKVYPSGIDGVENVTPISLEYYSTPHLSDHWVSF